MERLSPLWCLHRIGRADALCMMIPSGSIGSMVHPCDEWTFLTNGAFPMTTPLSHRLGFSGSEVHASREVNAWIDTEANHDSLSDNRLQSANSTPYDLQCQSLGGPLAVDLARACHQNLTVDQRSHSFDHASFEWIGQH